MRFPTLAFALKRAIAIVFCVIIGGFTVMSLVAPQLLSGAKETARLEPGDDPILNGLRILDRSRQDISIANAKNTSNPAIILLNDWSYTGKPKPSPFH